MEDQRDNPNIIGSEIIIYQTEDGYTKIDVKFEDETVWLTQAQLCELYQTSKSNISEHIKHIFEEEELDEESVVRKFRTTAADGKNYNTIHYNLDMIISLGYRVKSKIATNFRRWAAERLKEYMIKGFTMDDERLKNLGGGNYWKELLDRIRDIRSSEKVMYRQVLDLYATSVDYDPKSSESIAFFKMVQNKLHYAAHGHTAAEVIYERADASQPFMGLKSFSGDFPVLKDISIAKNYLNDEELKSRIGYSKPECHTTWHRARHHSLRDVEIYRMLANDIQSGRNEYVDSKSLSDLYEEKVGAKSPIHRYHVLRADEPSTTIISHLDRDGNRFIHYDPEQGRDITPREAARIQSFDDDFDFIGNQTDTYIMIGNAVPPLLAKCVGLAVSEVLDIL